MMIDVVLPSMIAILTCAGHIIGYSINWPSTKLRNVFSETGASLAYDWLKVFTCESHDIFGF